jgi:hypothetical protein
MARRQLIARTKKKHRVTKSETWLVNHKYLGDEPLLKDDYSQSQYGNALTWYNYMLSTNDAREYLETYLKHNNRAVEAKKIKSIPDTWVPTTAAWVSRIIMRGTNLPQRSRDFIEESLQRAFSKSEPEKTEAQKAAPTVSIQQRMKDKADEILGEIENLVDERANLTNFSLYDWLKKKEIPAVYAAMIPARYVAWLQELLDAVAGVDDQLVEAYARVPKKKMDYDIKFFNMLIEDAERYTDTTKKTRKPRKPRTISVEKKLKSFKYQKEDSNFKIASVSPEKIIGCQELWMFNTKYKTLTVLRAIDRGGIQVKGTSFTGYDEKNSFTKRTGRKPEQYVDKVLNGGKIILRKLMEEIKGEATLADRSNENTILLRVI